MPMDKISLFHLEPKWLHGGGCQNHSSSGLAANPARHDMRRTRARPSRHAHLHVTRGRVQADAPISSARLRPCREPLTSPVRCDHTATGGNSSSPTGSGAWIRSTPSLDILLGRTRCPIPDVERRHVSPQERSTHALGQHVRDIVLTRNRGDREVALAHALLDPQVS